MATASTNAWVSGGESEQDRIDRKVVEGTQQTLLAASSQVHNLKQIVEGQAKDISRVDNLCKSLTDTVTALSNTVTDQHDAFSAKQSEIMTEVSSLRGVNSRLDDLFGALASISARLPEASGSRPSSQQSQYQSVHAHLHPSFRPGMSPMVQQMQHPQHPQRLDCVPAGNQMYPPGVSVHPNYYVPRLNPHYASSGSSLGPPDSSTSHSGSESRSSHD